MYSIGEAEHNVRNHKFDMELNSIDYLFKDLDKDTISTWRENYDDTEEYHTVLPSKGYYNICNGSYGIGVAASSSIPQYNLKEVKKIGELAKKRIKDHIGRFNKLYEQIKSDIIDEKFLNDIYSKDKIFDEIDYMIYY